ncbi:MAG: peptidoglycan DD-metalloendopeptidase family protein [Bacteroidales bacterium]
MKNILYFLVAAIVLSCSYSNNSNSDEANLPMAPSVNKYGIDVNNYFVKNGEIERGDFFGSLLLKLGASANDIQGVIQVSKGVFDIAKLKTGNAYEVLYEKPDSIVVQEGVFPENDTLGKPVFFIYEVDKVSTVLFSLKDSVYAKIYQKEIVAEKKFTEVTIQSSLWNDVQAAGAPVQLALNLSDIYDCTIDFFGLQKGDSFRVMYDELVHEEQMIGLSHIYYVEFVHDKQVFKAVRFQEEEKGSKYWNELGESLKKAFLKAPLNFTRISSGFTYARRHPVLKIVRPHTGVDYAAPSGTPVVSLGDGVIVSKGWSGGGGNTLKIKHNSAYTTIYMHLKGFAAGLKVGQRVKQGQLVAYVGSTGMSTGPHLDFRVHKNGKPINPLTMESPSIEPVSKRNMEAFKSCMTGYRNQMDSLDAQRHLNSMLEVLR